MMRMLDPGVHLLEHVLVVDEALEPVGGAGRRLLVRRPRHDAVADVVDRPGLQRSGRCDAAPIRKPHGVVQIWSCCAHAVSAGVMFWR